MAQARQVGRRRREDRNSRTGSIRLARSRGEGVSYLRRESACPGSGRHHTTGDCSGGSRVRCKARHGRRPRRPRSRPPTRRYCPGWPRGRDPRRKSGTESGGERKQGIRCRFAATRGPSAYLGQGHFALAFHREQLADSRLACPGPRNRRMWSFLFFSRSVMMPAGGSVGPAGPHLDVRAQVDLIAHGDLFARPSRSGGLGRIPGRELGLAAISWPPGGAHGDKASGRRRLNCSRNKVRIPHSCSSCRLHLVGDSSTAPNPRNKDVQPRSISR